MQPFRGELSPVEVHSPEIRHGIISAAHHRACLFVNSVEMSHAGEVSFSPVSHDVFVAPSGIFRFSPYAVSAVRVVPHSVQSLACKTVKHGEQLFSL